MSAASEMDGLALRLGVDVGGTFTDFAVWDPNKGSFFVGKTLSTPSQISDAIINGAIEVMAGRGLSLSDVAQINHCTTVAGNLLIERKGAKAGLITTNGFRDILAMGRESRYDIYDLGLRKAEPLVGRELRRTVDERIDAKGNVLRGVDRDDVGQACQLFREQDVEAVAIVLINSYRNPEHEVLVQRLVEEELPDVHVSISSEVAPEIREFDRVSTTVANAYVQPLVARYLTELGARLSDEDFRGRTFLMLSGGGLTGVDVAARLPVRLVESGPTAGAVGAAHQARRAGILDFVSFDMGGTSAKICFIRDGNPVRTNEFEVARQHRFKRGSGLVLRVPAVDMIEIGAGGGSIASVDAMGLLKVGPESSGADPGPACYGRGGTRPTVTDAQVILGFLDPEWFLGGDFRLNADAAFSSIEEHVGRPLGVDVRRAAVGIYDVVTENMASATRVFASEQGIDLRGGTLFAFGGAGPSHAVRLARLLGMKSVLCPPAAGVFSAMGLLTAQSYFDFVQTYIAQLADIDWAHVKSVSSRMMGEALEILAQAGVSRDAVGFEFVADMRYVGQGFDIAVPMDLKYVIDGDATMFLQAFNARYAAAYGHRFPYLSVEMTAWRLTARGPRPEVDLGSLATPHGLKKASGSRDVYVHDVTGYRNVPVTDRLVLRPGETLRGPAIIQDRESAILLDAHCEAAVDSGWNVAIELL